MLKMNILFGKSNDSTDFIKTCLSLCVFFFFTAKDQYFFSKSLHCVEQFLWKNILAFEIKIKCKLEYFKNECLYIIKYSEYKNGWHCEQFFLGLKQIQDRFICFFFWFRLQTTAWQIFSRTKVFNPDKNNLNH